MTNLRIAGSARFGMGQNLVGSSSQWGIFLGPLCCHPGDVAHPIWSSCAATGDAWNCGPDVWIGPQDDISGQALDLSFASKGL